VIAGAAPWLSSDAAHDAIFVPAIMSAGLLFSIMSLLRDAAHDRRRRHRARRVRIAAAVLAEQVESGAETGATLARMARRPRAYLLTAATCIAVAVYVAVGATANYGADRGYVHHIAWLLGVSAITVTLLLWLGVGAGLLSTGPRRTPPWVSELLVSTPLGAPSGTEDERSQRRFVLGWVALLAAGSLGVIALGVGAASRSFQAADERALETVAGWAWLAQLEGADLLGRTEVAMAAALVVGVATLRCVPFAVAYVIAVLSSLTATTTLRVLVERQRPPGTGLSGAFDSFPSGHVVQAVLIAGLVPLAVRTLTGRRTLAAATAVLLASAAVLTGLERVHHGLHWPTDVLGGLALGATAVLVVRWSLETPSWHRRCHDCPWSPGPGPVHTVVHLPEWVRDHLRSLSRLVALTAVATFTTLALTVGIPRDPGGERVDETVELYGTLAALALLGASVLLSLRWPIVGAIGLAGGGLVLGALSSVAYHPAVSLVVAASFGLPAAGLWLGWQHGRTRRAVTVLAAVCALSAIGVYATAATVHDRFYGPTHPVSATPALPVGSVEWMWAGALRSDGFEVVARVGRGHETVALEVTADGAGEPVRTHPVPVPASRIVRLAVDHLEPATEHRYAVVADGVRDESRGAGRLRTAPAGPGDLRFAVGACARTGSDGSVFDAIREARPDLFLLTGDAHYGNPAVGDVDLFRRLIARVLESAPQAAMYREVPVAYVWDDHDYGPNDADSSSPTRDAAWQAYRELVPNVAGPTGPINQAFTLGRVRIVMTDTRSARTPATMLGAEQLAWLLDELRTASRAHALVVWVSSVPWIAPDDPTRDDWGGYAAERATILEAIHEASIENLIMLAGDAHMVALDDGTNSGGFPVLHAAALDRPGNVKGGPYSDGAFPGSGQFGLVDVRDDGGDAVEVTLSGRTWAGDVLVSRTFRFAVPADARP
jgi:membrane-associated phospholipid phosphatase